MNTTNPPVPPDSSVSPGFPRVGQLFRSRRSEHRLRIVEVARLAGLRDTAKSLRTLDQLERGGQGPLDLIKVLCGFYGIDLNAVREAWQLDEEDRKRFRWEAAGGRPYLLVKVIPAVYQRREVPAGLDRERAMAWAQAALKGRGHVMAGTLVLGASEAIWFREDGSFFVSDNGAVPYSSVRGRSFTFAVSAPRTEPE